MQKEKYLTQEDIDLLISENWLTTKQQQTFSIHAGVVKTRKEIEAICPDQTVLNFIFKDTVDLLPIGTKVKKISSKPFKSRQKINTIKGYVAHPKLNVLAYTFEEDESYVEIRRCVEVENVA